LKTVNRTVLMSGDSKRVQGVGAAMVIHVKKSKSNSQSYSSSLSR